MDLRKLIEVDKVQAIVTYFGYGTEAIAPIAKRKGVMVMALTFDLEHIAAPDSYAIWPSMKSHNEIMAATLKELGYKNVGIVVARSQGAVRAMDDLQTELKRIGVNNPSRIDILMSERDMRSVILKMNEAKCDIWVACLYRPGIDLLLRDANRLGDGWAVTGITCFDSLEDLSLANGRWYVRTALPTSEFESAFKAKTGHLPNPTAVYGYDAAKFLDEAFSASKGDLAGAKAYLAAQKTLSGEGGEYTSNGNGYFSSPAILATVRNGHIEGVTLEELKAAKK
jgi:hypothetical protein